jgi:hypothetical protein
MAIARCSLVARESCSATFTFGWDDRLVFRLNDSAPVDMGNHVMFDSKKVDVMLRAGPNELAVSLSNTTGLSSGGFCYSFGAETSYGEALLPEVFWPGTHRDERPLLAVSFSAGALGEPGTWSSFVPPYATDLSGAELGDVVELIGSPQAQSFPGPEGPIQVTVGTGDYSGLSFRRREKASGCPFQTCSELLSGEVCAEADPAGNPSVLILTLDGLPAGDYVLTSYHHLHALERTLPPLQVSVNGTEGNEKPTLQTTGMNPEQIAVVKTLLHGGGPVCVGYKASGPVVMNGFELAYEYSEHEVLQ